MYIFVSEIEFPWLSESAKLDTQWGLTLPENL